MNGDSGLNLDDVLTPSGFGPWRVQLLPVAEAPALTRASFRRAEKGQELQLIAEVDLTTVDLEGLAELCRGHAERARPHLLAAIDRAMIDADGDEVPHLDF